MSILALAQGALRAVFDPGGAAEAGDVVLVRARLGDVVADGVGLAGVGDTAGTALALGHHRELAVHGRAGQRPAVHLALQALALLAVLHPGVPAAVGEQAVLVQTLAAQAGVALGAAEQVGVGVVAVANHPAAHHLAGLAGAHGAPIAVQHPDLPTVLDLVVMDTVTGAVVAVRAPAVVASVQVEAHGVVGTGVPPRFAFINIYARFPTGGKQAVVMVAVTALTVVPAGQVDTSGFTITLDKAVRTLVNIRLASLPRESLLAYAVVR